jgi:hypothetical protein
MFTQEDVRQLELLVEDKFRRANVCHGELWIVQIGDQATGSGRATIGLLKYD